MKEEGDSDRYEVIVEGVKLVMADLEQLVTTMKAMKEYGQTIPVEMREKANDCITQLERVLGPMPWIESDNNISFYEYYRSESKRVGRDNYASRLGISPNFLTSLAKGKKAMQPHTKILLRLDMEKRLGPVVIQWPGNDQD
jgi:hypothetical protein